MSTILTQSQNKRSFVQRSLIEIRVEPYPYPVSYKGEYHIRSGSTQQELKGAALDRFLLKKHGLHWDAAPMPGLSLSALAPETMLRFRHTAVKAQRLPEECLQESDALLLERLHLYQGDYLKRAAALLFHPDPEKYVGGAWIKLGFFAHDNTDLRYQDEVHGTLFHQVEQTLDTLKAKYLKAVISYEGLYRQETWPLPMQALREALLNAVIHKDYARAIPIQISAYFDKLMIWNPGVLPDRWTLDDLMQKHASHPFNPDVANAFFRAGLIESWGRGIERIMATCNAEKEPAPQWQLDPAGGLWTTFNYPESYIRQLENAVLNNTLPEATQETTQEKMLSLIRANPAITRNGLAEKLGITPDGVKYHLQKLKAQGRIKHIGPTKTGRWEIIE